MCLDKGSTLNSSLNISRTANSVIENQNIDDRDVSSIDERAASEVYVDSDEINDSSVGVRFNFNRPKLDISNIDYLKILNAYNNAAEENISVDNPELEMEVLENTEGVVKNTSYIVRIYETINNTRTDSNVIATLNEIGEITSIRNNLSDYNKEEMSRVAFNTSNFIDEDKLSITLDENEEVVNINSRLIFDTQLSSYVYIVKYDLFNSELDYSLCKVAKFDAITGDLISVE